jgi:hypothetical protein
MNSLMKWQLPNMPFSFETALLIKTAQLGPFTLVLNIFAAITDRHRGQIVLEVREIVKPGKVKPGKVKNGGRFDVDFHPGDQTSTYFARGSRHLPDCLNNIFSVVPRLQSQSLRREKAQLHCWPGLLKSIV